MNGAVRDSGLDRRSLLLALKETSSAIANFAHVVAELRPEDREIIHAAFARIARVQFDATDALRAGDAPEPAAIAPALDAAIDALVVSRQVLVRAELAPGAIR